MKKINLEQGTPAWIAYRQNGVGASDIPNIAGLDGAFKSRQAVLIEKTSQTPQAAPNAYLESIFQQGHEWEKVVRDHLNSEQYSFEPAVVEHPTEPRFFASLDGLDEKRGVILEVKSCTSQQKFDALCAKVPEHYEAQVQWQLLCTGYKEALFAVVFNGNVNTRIIAADTFIQADLVQHAAKFLADMDAQRETGLSLVQNIVTPDVQALVLLKTTAASLQARLDAIDAEVKSLAEQILKDNKAVKVENEMVSIQIVEKEGAVDYKKIPELQNIDLNKYRRKGSSYIRVTLK